MRGPKRVFLTAVLGAGFFLLFSSSSQAAPSGGGTEDFKKFSVGLVFNEMLEKEMKPDASSDFSTLKIKRADQYYLHSSYQFFKNAANTADVFVKLGQSNLVTTGTDKITHQNEDVRYNPGLLWGVGATASHRFENTATVSLQGQWNGWGGGIDELKFNGQRASGISGDDKFRVSEFQAALIFSTDRVNEDRQMTFRPYVGPTLNWMSLNRGDLQYAAGGVTRSAISADASGDRLVGFVAGLDWLTLNDALRVNVEVSLLSGEAFTLSIHYRF